MKIASSLQTIFRTIFELLITAISVILDDNYNSGLFEIDRNWLPKFYTVFLVVIETGAKTAMF
jgi:hypothetical protein